MNHPISGFQYLIDGFRLLSKPGLRRFVVIPLFINIILFVLLFILMRHYMGEFNVWFESYLPAWLKWLGTVLWLLFFISFFLILIYTFVTIANIIAAPFNSLLAEKVEYYLSGSLPESKNLLENIKDMPRIIGRQISILIYYLPRAVFILILFFIPVVQAIAAILWFLFNAWFMTLTYIDYPTDNHRIPLRDVRVWLKQKKGVSFGFGISVLIFTMIPFLNFFTIPAAVAGATKFWVNESKLAK